MKLIIAGSRTLEFSPEKIRLWVGLGFFDYITKLEIVSGTARGIDMCGEKYAKQYKFPVHLFPADWETHGKKAGHIRNAEMAKFADGLLLIWDGQSKGSANMKKQMELLNKPVYEVIIKKTESEL